MVHFPTPQYMFESVAVLFRSFWSLVTAILLLLTINFAYLYHLTFMLLIFLYGLPINAHLCKHKIKHIYTTCLDF